MGRNRGKSNAKPNQRAGNKAVPQAAKVPATAAGETVVQPGAENPATPPPAVAAEDPQQKLAGGPVSQEQDSASAAAAAGAAETETKGVSDGETTQQAVEGAEAATAQGAGLSDGQAGGGEPAVSGDPGQDLEDDHHRAWSFDIAGLARAIAGGARLFADGGKVTEYQDVFSDEEAAIMADFVRDNPEAPAAAMFNHLTLKKRLPRTIPNRADEFVLSLFHAACLAAHKFEADQAAEEAARAAKAAPAAPQWPGEQAMKPSDPAFAPTGFSPR
ncbi:hypothetical protein MPL1032_190145 [Mesorhizobium plurifarium]|uniref:Uncharacterized protein n=1 Tax=Mesorhizobium plurifarium TaxID=69974 RepID=A0A0K2VVL0_MESPL|nr:hypothetical protein MPL1032_190145 [Mesorhizobium plurifarium]